MSGRFWFSLPGAPFGNSRRFRPQNDAVEFFAGASGAGGGRFEDPELRDIAAAAEPLLVTLLKHGLEPGATVCDVGAGTGLLVGGLAAAVRPDGTVEAVELSPVFTAHLTRRAKAEGLNNVRASQCTERELGLGPGTVDLALCVDVYHHFEYPRTFCKSIRRALRPGGRFVVVDFHRDPAKMVAPSHRGSWVLEHVRADKATFIAEIEQAGFKLIAEPAVPELRENYVLVFEPV